MARWMAGMFTRPSGFGVFGYERLRDDAGDVVGVYLGKHRGAFSGTDALSYRVLPDAARWAEVGDLPRLVFGEGARLAHLKFLLPLAARTDLVLVSLTADGEALAERRTARANTQSEAWMKGAATRARNVAATAREAGLRVVEVDTTGKPPETVARELDMFNRMN